MWVRRQSHPSRKLCYSTGSAAADTSPCTAATKHRSAYMVQPHSQQQQGGHLQFAMHADTSPPHCSHTSNFLLAEKEMWHTWATCLQIRHVFSCNAMHALTSTWCNRSSWCCKPLKGSELQCNSPKQRWPRHLQHSSMQTAASKAYVQTDAYIFTGRAWLSIGKIRPVDDNAERSVTCCAC